MDIYQKFNDTKPKIIWYNYSEKSVDISMFGSCLWPFKIVLITFSQSNQQQGVSSDEEMCLLPMMEKAVKNWYTTGNTTPWNIFKQYEGKLKCTS